MEVESVEYIPYVIKPIHHLQIVIHNTISYPFKYVDRKVLDDCYARRQMADDVLIAKEGVITDTYYGNVAFYSDSTWYTPKTPLLKGTRRQQLLDNKRIMEKEILVDDLNNYSKLSIFNAMIPLGKVVLNINNIYPSK
jgi:4-amino-4-deoxychorismate lyase